MSLKIRQLIATIGVGAAPQKIGYLVDGFNSITGWSVPLNGALVLDVSDKLLGTGSMSITPNGSPAAPLITTKTAALVGDASTWGLVAYLVKMPDEFRPMVSTAFQVGIGATYYGNAINANSVFDTGYFWQIVDFSKLGVPAGNNTLNLRFRAAQATPYAGRVLIDSVVRNAPKRPTIVITFDDTENTHRIIAAPYLQTKGMKATTYITKNWVGLFNKLNLTQTKELQDIYGWDISCDSPTGNSWTAYPTLAAAITALQEQQQWLVDNGMPSAKDYLDYPNGAYNVSVTPVVTNATATNSAVVTVVSSTGITAGMSAWGFGVPSAIKVLSVDSPTQVTLDTPITIATLPLQFVDRSGEFFGHKLPKAFKAAGIKLGRCTLNIATNQHDMYTAFGFGEQHLTLSCAGLTGMTQAQMTALVDGVIDRGTTLIIYMHRITAAGGSINIKDTDFYGLIDYIAAKRDEGLLDVLKISELYERDKDGLLRIHVSEE